MMSNAKETPILSNWLEEKLKQHFVRKSMPLKTWWNVFSREPNFTSLFLPNQPNGAIPIQTLVSDFRILDFKMEKNKNRKKKARKSSNGNLPDNLQNHDHEEDANASDKMFQSPPPSDSPSWRKSGTDEPYQKQDSHVWLVYQETCQSIGKEMWLHLQASQIDDVKSTEDIIPKYELSLDEHQIDVHTRIFPALKHWISSLKISVTLPVQECFYGSYETEEQTNTFGDEEEDNADNGELNDNIADPMFEDDIMSKVAAGLEFYERERRRRERKAGKQSSYRLLILEDISRQGFKPRNVGDYSTFLSLLNAEEALKSLAEIHSVSWAYTQVFRKSLLNTWPFLNNPLYLPYLKERVLPGFSSMQRLVQAYLISSGKETMEDGDRILKSLMKVGQHLEKILEGAKHPTTVKCLIHQSACFSSFLFKYSVLKTAELRAKKGKEQCIKSRNCDDKNSDGRDNDNNNRSGIGQARTSLYSEPLNCKGNDDVISTARRECLKKGLSREVMIINWRTASVGSPMIDVAFLLLTALPPKTRRAETASLLRIYWNTFQMHAKKFGVSLSWSEKELYKDYLGALLYTCVLITGNVTGSQCELDDEGMEVFIEAVKDLMKENMI